MNKFKYILILSPLLLANASYGAGAGADDETVAAKVIHHIENYDSLKAAIDSGKFVRGGIPFRESDLNLIEYIAAQQNAHGGMSATRGDGFEGLLDISGCRADGKVLVQLFGVISPFMGWSVFHFANNDLNDSALRTIMRLLVSSSTKVVDLERNSLSPEGVAQLMAMNARRVEGPIDLKVGGQIPPAVLPFRKITP